jgi:Ca2+-binding RTX toxin-like protein
MGSNSGEELNGTLDDNVIHGRGGDDVISGGLGMDIFVFDNNWGDDVITDFEDTSDLLDISDTSLMFADLSISQSGEDVLIDGGGNTIILESMLVTDITESDFII